MARHTKEQHDSMYETCLRFIPRRVLEWLIEDKPHEVVLAKFGASREIIC